MVGWTDGLTLSSIVLSTPLCVNEWLYLVMYGQIKLCTAMNGMHGCVFMARYGLFWSSMLKFIYVWTCMVMHGRYGHVWSCMVLMVMCDLGLVMYRHRHVQCMVKYVFYGYVWSCMALYDFVRSCKVQSRKYMENIE